MRYSTEHKSHTRQHIIQSAATQLRMHGLNGVGVATLMQTAGMTHGGFYAHFKTKIALIVEAIDTSLAETFELLQRAAEKAAGGKSRRAIVDAYLSTAHRDEPGKGCAIAALGTDIARLKPQQRKRIDSRIELLLELISDQSSTCREEAIVQLSTMIGGLVLARVVASKDLSNEILDTLKASYSDDEI
jgi:TetR/AcrR family transcriptional repressor of nem operon